MSVNHARKWEQSYAPQSPQREKQVKVKVHKKSWISKGEKVLYSVIGLCLIAACIYVVSYSSTSDTLNRKLQSLEQTVQQQEVKNENLVYEKKQLSRPERITRIAKENGLEIQSTEVKQATAFNQ
ncbi:cell division protein FtsL [Virgibacillus kekensis]|uniref:Cell division protein FtsL n=1 Tax=Virgibacillus kekensis TaxID=202261 RepID=A0ABV9DDX6_9BACI